MMRKDSRGLVNRERCWFFLVTVKCVSFSQAGVGLCADDGLFSEARRERGTEKALACTALNVNGSKPLADAFEKNIRF